MGQRERRRRRDAATLAVSPPPPLRAVPTVDTLRRLVEQRDQLERTITWEIDRLAQAGVGWPRIASALGGNRPAVRQAWLRRHPPAPSSAAPGLVEELVSGLPHEVAVIVSEWGDRGHDAGVNNEVLRHPVERCDGMPIDVLVGEQLDQHVAGALRLHLPELGDDHLS